MDMFHFKVIVALIEERNKLYRAVNFSGRTFRKKREPKKEYTQHRQLFNMAKESPICRTPPYYGHPL